MFHIPSELIHDILIRLPAESLFRFRAVCKAWQRFIDDPCFIKSHTNTYSHTHITTLLLTNRDASRLYSLSWDSLNYDDDHQTIYITLDKALGQAGLHRLITPPVLTCNGLIVTSHTGRKKIMVIYNPLTHEFHEVPGAPLEDYWSRIFPTLGFGYDSVADDYKIVMIDKVLFTPKSHVYSLKSNSWSTTTIKKSRGFITPRGTGVYVNGALYWSTSSQNGAIFVLDLATNEYQLLSGPPNCFVPGGRFHLHVLDGFLACSYKCRMDGLVVWLMRENGAWTKLFSWREFDFIGGGVNFMAEGGLNDVRPLRRHSHRAGSLYIWPVAYWENKGQLLFFQRRSDKFFLWDIVNHSVKIVTLDGHVELRYYSHICGGSLFRLGRLSRTLPTKLTGEKRKRKGSDRRRLDIYIGEANE